MPPPANPGRWWRGTWTTDALDKKPEASSRSAVADALAASAKLNYAPHLEVETYTWSFLPGVVSPDLAEGLARELEAAEKLMGR